MPFVNRIGLIVVGLGMILSACAAAAQVVAVVSAKNPVTALGKSHLMDIFLGKSIRFEDGSQAVPIDQVEGSALRDEFYTKFGDKSAAQLKAHWSKVIFTGKGQPPREAANSTEVKKRIAENPNAIGYIEQNMVDGSVKVLLVK